MTAKEYMQRLVNARKLYLALSDREHCWLPSFKEDNRPWARKLRQAHRRILGLERRVRIAYEREAA